MKALVVEDPTLVNTRNENGKTVLHYAAQGGHADLVAVLIQAGASVDSANSAGETPLHYASAMGHEEVVRVLLDHHASAVVVDSGSNTPWLGQEPPGMEPELFLPEVLSQGERGACTGFLNNGTVFVFKQLSPETDWKFEPVYFVELKDGRWTDPVVAPFSDLFPYNFTVAPDGKALYFASLRSAEDHGVILPKADVWKVEKTADGWSEPETFGAPVNSEGHFENYPSITSDGTLYFMSWRDEGLGKDDIYRLQLVDGEYIELENIGGPVNTEHSEVDPFIGADESYLIFCSKTLGGFGGYDLYISFRTQDGSWTSPVNMGEGINSAEAEFRPLVTPDGKYFFFTSDRSGVGESYWVDAGIIHSLRRLQPVS